MASHDNLTLETSRMFRPGNFPSWARPGLGRRGRTSYSKPLCRDKIKPVDTVSCRAGKSGESVTDNKLSPRDKELAFLKSQHSDVLRGLHGEIERLKAENKDLQFKLVMTDNRETRSEETGEGNVMIRSCSQDRVSIDLRQEREDKKAKDMQSFFEQELQDLRMCLQEQLEKNTKLTEQIELIQVEHQQLLGQSMSGVPTAGGVIFLPSAYSHHVQQPGPTLPHLSRHGPVRLVSQSQSNETLRDQYQQPQQRQESIPPYKLNGRGVAMPGGAGLQIFTAEQVPRLPTLQECESIIRHLQQVNDKLQHELISVRSDLRDVLYSSKWTPDAFLLAKRYVKENSLCGADRNKPPNQNIYGQKRELPHHAHKAVDGVSLPPLKPNLENRVADRHRRQQATQKAIFRREVLQ